MKGSFKILRYSLPFIYQVHHIDPKGQDSGVVYNEMQGNESGSKKIMDLQSVAISNLLIVSNSLMGIVL